MTIEQWKMMDDVIKADGTLANAHWADGGKMSLFEYLLGAYVEGEM